MFQRETKPFNPGEITNRNLKAGFFRDVTKERINVVDGFGEEMNLVPLQDAGSLVGIPYLALNSRKTWAAGTLGLGSACASSAS